MVPWPRHDWYLRHHLTSYISISNGLIPVGTPQLTPQYLGQRSSISAGITLARLAEAYCAFGVSEDCCRGRGRLTAVVLVVVTAQIDGGVKERYFKNSEWTAWTNLLAVLTLKIT